VPQLRCAISHSMKLRIERTKHRIFVASHSHLLISVPGPRAALDRLAAFLFGTIAGQSADCPVPAHVHGPVTAIFVDEQLPAVYEPETQCSNELVRLALWHILATFVPFPGLAQSCLGTALALAGVRVPFHSFPRRGEIRLPSFAP